MGKLFKLFHKLLHDPGPVWYIRPLLNTLNKVCLPIEYRVLWLILLTFHKIHNRLKLEVLNQHYKTFEETRESFLSCYGKWV